MSSDDCESSPSGLFQDAASVGTNMSSKNVVFKKICKDKSVSEEHHFLFISGIFLLAISPPVSYYHQLFYELCDQFSGFRHHTIFEYVLSCVTKLTNIYIYHLKS